MRGRTKLLMGGGVVVIGAFVYVAILPLLPQPHLAPSYVAAYANKVAFLQLTQTGSTLVGTMQVAEYEASTDQVATETWEVSGTDSGGSITFTITAPSGSATYSGAVVNGDIRIYGMNSKGIVGYTLYAPAPASTFDGDVNYLYQKAQQAPWG